ncbi:protein DBF4 homolog B [Ursus maritimus]|uniref:Protein DBF4 homolog B n=1 Tax=Ursus maritimus TaxID=29073 RepID=A0A384CCE5_URSMA|nr:protein DBF4 homolog B [Ursus maritimus]
MKMVLLLFCPFSGDGKFSELQSSMAERRLRTPDLGTQLGVSSCLEKCRKSSPDAGRQPFSGKSFYLDLPAGKSLQFLTGAIQQLGGVIEGFLSKEVSYIVSSRREAKAESSGTSPRGCPSPSEVRGQTPSMALLKGGHTRPSQKPADAVPTSRGKELLQKAIRNQESGRGGGGGSSSSLLTSARSWGVRILHVDEMLMHVQQLSLDALCGKKHGPKKKAEGTCPAESRTRKVARLKAPFLKIEDESRKFRPFHHQFKSFPEISFLGPKDASPFEAMMTPGGSHATREPKDREPSLRSAARTLPRRRKGFCECCQEAFEELHAHLQSTRHRGFVLEAHPYIEVDRVIAQLGHSLADAPSQTGLPRQLGSPSSDGDPLWPETLPSSQPSHPRAASPRLREEDGHQTPGAPEQDGTVGSMKPPAEPVRADKMLGPVASCQELGESMDVIADSPGTPASKSPVHPCLPTSCGSAEFSGLDVAPVGHKRKVQFLGGNPEKRLGSPSRRPRSSSQEPAALVAPGQAVAGLSCPFPFQAVSTGLWPPSSPHGTHRPASPSQSPSPGSPQRGQQSAGPHSPLGREDDGPPGSEESECAAPGPVSGWLAHSPAALWLQASCPAHLHSAADVQAPGGPARASLPLSPALRQPGSRLLPVVLGPPPPRLPAPAEDAPVRSLGQQQLPT